MSIINLLSSAILSVFLAAGCGGSNEGGNLYSNEAAMPESISKQTDKNQSVENTSPMVEKKIIKNGNMSIKVPSLDKAKHHADTLLNRYKGYYANEQLGNTERNSAYHLTIRIPAQCFEQFILDLENGNGEVLNKNINANDVTEQFIDLEIRLKNKRNYLARYTELLNRANSVKEVLEVEERIRVLEEEIESTQGRLKYLNSQVNYSTLELHLTKDHPYIYKPVSRDSFIERFKASLANGWHGFIEFLFFILRLWPFILMIVSGIWLFKRVRSRKR